MFTVAIKSGTNGYLHPENKDFIIAQIPSTNVPNVGDILEIGSESIFVYVINA